MVVVKLLERKSVIRLFGVALVLAPFFNILMSMSLQTNIANRWTTKVFFKIISTSSTFDHLLYIASFIIGLIMLSGSAAAWRWVLVLLGGVIANQTMNLGQNFRSNWMSVPFFIVNVSIFLFILDQLAWKQKKPAAATKPAPRPAAAEAPVVQKENLKTEKPSTPVETRSVPTQTPTSNPMSKTSAPTPAPAPASPSVSAPTPIPVPTASEAPAKPVVVASNPVPQPKPVLTETVKSPATTSAQFKKTLARPASFQTQKKVLVHFAGIGAWAQVMSISKDGLHVRSLKQPPADIHSRDIEISLKNGLHLQMRLSHQSGQDFYFGYNQLTPQDIRLLNQWLQQVA